MRNQNISDFVAATMDAVLKSQEHRSLFATQYKSAEDVNDAKHKEDDKDSCMADDNDAKEKCHTCHKPMSKCECDSSKASDQNDAKHKKDSKDSKDSSSADDNDVDSTTANPYPKQYDASSADDSSEEKVSSAYDVAIDSFLTASAALDSVGLGRGSAISLKLASLVINAKKKEKESKKSKDSGKSSAKSKDSNSAKDKKSDKSSKDSHSAKDKKSDKSSKDSHSAKDKKSDKSSSSSSSKDSKKSSKK